MSKISKEDKRKKVTDWLVSAVNDVIKGYNTNGELLREMLDGLSLADFESYIRNFKVKPNSGVKRSILAYYLPNLSKHKISIARLFDLHDKIGRPASQRLVMTDSNTGVKYLTPHLYPIVILPVRRQSQTIDKKASIPSGQQPIDELTHQPVQSSKGSSVTQPEIGSLAGRNLDATLYELLNVRGGNEVARREFRRQLINSGSGSLDSLRGIGSIKSVDTLSVYLNGMHLGNNTNPDTKVPEDELRRYRAKIN